jgi:hypothetical protein
MAWRFATWPTIRSPVLENATTDGVVLAPSALAMTTASPPSMTETQEFVVPRSIPMIFPMFFSSNISYLFLVFYSPIYIFMMPVSWPP